MKARKQRTSEPNSLSPVVPDLYWMFEHDGRILPMLWAPYRHLLTTWVGTDQSELSALDRRHADVLGVFARPNIPGEFGEPLEDYVRAATIVTPVMPGVRHRRRVEVRGVLDWEDAIRISGRRLS